MNKTIAEIYAELVTYKEQQAALAGLTSTSKTAIWRLMLWVVAFGIFIFQEAAQLHLTEVKNLIAEQKVFRLTRYRYEALRFQYGFDLIPETDQFRPEFLLNGVLTMATAEQIAQSKIIKYAACSRVLQGNKHHIVMKIAPEDLDAIFPPDVMTAFEEYISEIQPAGDHVSIVNYLPDMLKFSFKIKRDPLVLLSDGMNILSGEYPVQIAIEKFLKESLPFNGELSVQALEDAIRKVDGVIDLQTLSIETKWIDPNANGYGLYQPVGMSVIPASGRFKIEDFAGLQYII